MQNVLVCLAVAAVVAAAEIPGSCSWDSGRGASFDLSRLRRPANQGWQIKDIDPETHDFNYTFNVCADVAAPRTWNETVGAYNGNECETTHAEGEYMATPAAAYQYAANERYAFCYRLSGGYAQGNFSLFDEADPSAGVVLTYTGGNRCGEDFRRSLRLTLLCRDDQARAVNIPDMERVREPIDTPCLYEFRIKSGFGCPTECPVVRDRPCGGNGVCGYDPVRSVARCFCNQGMTGVDCSTEEAVPPKPMAASAVALLVVCLLLLLVLSFLGYVWMKMRRLQLDPDAYAQLGHKFNELGQITAAPVPDGKDDVDFQE